MQQNIKTLFRLSLMPVVAIVPFTLMHKHAASCSQITGVKVCISNSSNPSMGKQLAVSAAATALIYLAYRLWKWQLKNIEHKHVRGFIFQNILLTLAVALGSARAYLDIKYNHSQEGSNAISAHISSSSTPVFGYGLRPIVFWLLLAVFVAMPIISLYQTFGSQNLLKTLGKR